MLVLASLVVALLVPSPQPTNPFTLDPLPKASPLPLIGTTRSRSLCTAMKRAVLPAVAAAMTNDKTYTGFRKSMVDYVITNSTTTRDFKLMLMDHTVQQMVKSVGDLETSLDSNDFIIPPNATQRDAEALSAMRDALKQILVGQKVELDAMSGFVETERMRAFGQLQEGENNLQNSLAQPNTNSGPKTYSGPSATNDGTVTQAARGDVGVGDVNSTHAFLHDSNDFFRGRSNISIRQAHILDSDLGLIADYTTHKEESATKIIVPATQLCK